MTVIAGAPVKIKIPSAVKYWDEASEYEVTLDAETTTTFKTPGLYWMWDAVTPDDHKQVTVYSADYHTPDWIKSGVCYHVFIDRFADGKRSISNSDFVPEWTDDKIGLDMCGGNLAGVRSNLSYLAELGVNCLYLSPIFTASSSHKYNTSDYEMIDPDFGDIEEFKLLCSDANKLGIRIILDGVFSHCGKRSRYYESHPDWFLYEDDNKTPMYWWGVESLPVFDKTNPKYIEYITATGGIAERWLNAGASGWRLDVVDELPDVFLDPLCERIKSVKSDALIIGEVWEDASNKIAYGVRRRYFLGGQLDGTMNYPLREAIIKFVLGEPAEALADHMRTFMDNTPKPARDCMMNVLGTHDTVRIITALSSAELPKTRSEYLAFRLKNEQYELGKQRLKLASALQFTLPGFPCIYYGDEAGAQGGADPFNRMPFPWGKEDIDIINWYKYLGKLRKEYSEVLSNNDYKLIKAEGKIFEFSRGNLFKVSLNVGNLTVEIQD